MSKYVELIVRTKEEANNALAAPRAAEQNAALGLAIGKLQLEISGQQNSLADLKGKYPLPVDEIVGAGDELALNQRRLSQLQQLQSELFGS
jgi:hypothetical protein